jgi:hypothetical protein
MLMKNANDTIGNRSRDLLLCNAVPQPLRHRLLKLEICYLSKILSYFDGQITDEKVGGVNNSQRRTRNLKKSFSETRRKGTL